MRPGKKEGNRGKGSSQKGSPGHWVRLRSRAGDATSSAKKRRKVIHSFQSGAFQADKEGGKRNPVHSKDQRACNLVKGNSCSRPVNLDFAKVSSRDTATAMGGKKDERTGRAKVASLSNRPYRQQTPFWQRQKIQGDQGRSRVQVLPGITYAKWSGGQGSGSGLEESNPSESVSWQGATALEKKKKRRASFLTARKKAGTKRSTKRRNCSKRNANQEGWGSGSAGGGEVCLVPPQSLMGSASEASLSRTVQQSGMSAKEVPEPTHKGGGGGRLREKSPALRGLIGSLSLNPASRENQAHQGRRRGSTWQGSHLWILAQNEEVRERPKKGGRGTASGGKNWRCTWKGFFRITTSRTCNLEPWVGRNRAVEEKWQNWGNTIRLLWKAQVDVAFILTSRRRGAGPKPVGQTT